MNLPTDSNKTLRDSLADIEDQAHGFKYDFQIADEFRKMLEENKTSLTETEQKQLEWEFLLFRLMTKNRFNNDMMKTPRFVPMATFTDGSIFPDPGKFPSESFKYFETRSTESKNPIFKSRYLDFLWENSDLEDKHLFAVEAISEYVEAVDAYENEDAIIEKLDCIQRATELALIFENKKKDKPNTTKVVTKIKTLINEIGQSKKYRWLIELFEVVIALSDSFSKKEIKSYIALIDNATASYHAEGNFHLQRSFLELKGNMLTVLEKNESNKKVVLEEIGQSYVDEAEAKSGSGLVKVHFLEEAIRHYANLGDKAKVKQLTGEVKKATKQAIDNNEFKEISASIKIDTKDIEKMKASLGTGKEVPINMGTLPTFFPNWDHAIKMTKDFRKKFVYQQIFSTVHYGDKYPLGRPQTPEEEEEDRIMHNFKIEADLALNWLTGFLSELINEKKVTYKDFEDFLNFLDHVDANTKATVLKGVRFYFDGDHLSASYILTLQLEDFLRLLLDLFGEQTTIPEQGGFREKTLGSILTELKPYISEPVYRYIDWVMRDYRGLNLRNNIAHGFFKSANAHPRYSTAVLHIYCLLIATTKISVTEKQPND